MQRVWGSDKRSLAMKREMSVAGSFYPSEREEILRYIERFSAHYDSHSELPLEKPKAVIVPHAGYVYSGYTANVAYRMLQNSKIKNLLVIGPSHRIGFDGISICESSSYVTPFGNIEANETMVDELKSKFNLTYIPQAHHEHSTEVQFPFIKHYMQDVKIVELVYSQSNSDSISSIINHILIKDEWGVVISTDLSHFHMLQDANRIDNVCLNAVEKLDLNLLKNGCEACGMIGVEAMMKSAISHGLKSEILDYRTSADASGDKSRVVGYLSAYFI